MIDLILFCFLGVLSTAIAVFGGHLSSSNRKYRLVFYLLGGASVILVLFTGYRTYSAQIAAKKDSKRLEGTVRTIENMSKEAVRIGSLNTQLEERLLSQSEIIARLSEKSINTTTGGDSFCYLFIHPTESGTEWVPSFIHSGKYPLYGVHARVVDLEKFREILKKGQKLTLHDASEKLIRVGDMTVGTSSPMWNIRIPWSDSPSHAYNVFFSGRNGLWEQQVRLRRIDGRWVRATVVKKYTGKKPQVLYLQIDELFPKNDKGQVNWDELPGETR